MWEKVEMLKYHSHMLTHFINVCFWICNINAIKDNLSGCRTL